MMVKKALLEQPPVLTDMFNQMSLIQPIFCWLGYCLTRDKKKRISSEISDKIVLKLMLISLSSLFLAQFGGHTLRMVLSMKDGLMEGTLRDIPHFWNNLLHLPSFVRNLCMETACGFIALLAGNLPMLIYGSIQEEKRFVNRTIFAVYKEQGTKEYSSSKEAI